ncbi:hypothetical protein JCM16138_01390 [Thermococcus atlanticus]
MADAIKDSVEVALELDEKEVYSHIAHESAEDMIRIISSIDAERARNKGEVIYYEDDWDDLIRQRIQKGKRHTAFDFYNPMLLDIWEKKVYEAKRIKRIVGITWGVIGAIIVLTGIATAITGVPWIVLGLAYIPLMLYARSYRREKLDLIYYELSQFFIDEMRELLDKHGLDPYRYGFKIFNYDYFGILTRKIGGQRYAVISRGQPLNTSPSNNNAESGG